MEYFDGTHIYSLIPKREEKLRESLRESTLDNMLAAVLWRHVYNNLFLESAAEVCASVSLIDFETRRIFQEHPVTDKFLLVYRRWFKLMARLVPEDAYTLIPAIRFFVINEAINSVENAEAEILVPRQRAYNSAMRKMSCGIARRFDIPDELGRWIWSHLFQWNHLDAYHLACQEYIPDSRKCPCDWHSKIYKIKLNG